MRKPYYSSFVYLVFGPDVYGIDYFQTLWPHNHLNATSGSEGYIEYYGSVLNFIPVVLNEPIFPEAISLSEK